MTEELDLTTHNPSCTHYDEYLGVCGHPEGLLRACRKKICPERAVGEKLLEAANDNS